MLKCLLHYVSGKVKCHERIVYISFNFFFRRVGRRKILMISFLVAAVGAIGALLLTDKAEDDQGTSST